MVGIVYPPMKSWNDSMSANELVSIFTMLNHRVALGGMSISKAAMLTSVIAQVSAVVPASHKRFHEALIFRVSSRAMKGTIA